MTRNEINERMKDGAVIHCGGIRLEKKNGLLIIDPDEEWTDGVLADLDQWAWDHPFSNGMKPEWQSIKETLQSVAHSIAAVEGMEFNDCAVINQSRAFVVTFDKKKLTDSQIKILHCVFRILTASSESGPFFPTGIPQIYCNIPNL